MHRTKKVASYISEYLKETIFHHPGVNSKKRVLHNYQLQLECLQHKHMKVGTSQNTDIKSDVE